MDRAFDEFRRRAEAAGLQARRCNDTLDQRFREHMEARRAMP